MRPVRSLSPSNLITLGLSLCPNEENWLGSPTLYNSLYWWAMVWWQEHLKEILVLHVLSISHVTSNNKYSCLLTSVGPACMDSTHPRLKLSQKKLHPYWTCRLYSCHPGSSTLQQIFTQRLHQVGLMNNPRDMEKLYWRMCENHMQIDMNVFVVWCPLEPTPYVTNSLWTPRDNYLSQWKSVSSCWKIVGGKFLVDFVWL